MGFFSKKEDLNVYPMQGWQRQNLQDQQYREVGRINNTELAGPDRFWGSNLTDTFRRTGLDAFAPEGGLGYNDLIGGGPGGGGGGGGGYSPAMAHAGLASASLVDLNTDPFNRNVPADARSNFVGTGRSILSGQANEAIRGMTNRSALTGLGGNAIPYLTNLLRTQQSEQLGNLYAGFETDWIQKALGRQAEARGLNAQLGTNVSVANAQNQTQVGIANAGARNAASAQRAAIGASQSAALSARKSAATELLLGMWDREQNRDLERYALQNKINMGYQSPVGEKTKSPGWGMQLLQGAGAAAGGLGELIQGWKA